MRKTISIPAKINLYLDVIGKYENGYHELESVMQSISIYDEISIDVKTDSTGFVLKSDVECDDITKNTMYKSYFAFIESYGNKKTTLNKPLKECHVEIAAKKNIPSKAGLGGASADAAGVLILLNSYLETPISIGDLIEIGTKVGADVPFCINQGTMKAGGIGELLIKLPSFKAKNVIIAKPLSEEVSTKEAFEIIDRNNMCKKDGNIDSFISSLNRLDYIGMKESTTNKFEKILSKDSDVFKIKQLMYNKGALISQMTGSGSAVFGIFDNIDENLILELKNISKVFICKTL